ncbi:protein of unknown function [Salegentibacter echinorum]|uniref:DUF4419 domain-containing protein n=1 Tax=Salegentibacter echinorum TaxID=1073325 RepID=A0A1M5KTK2_SALEC|nr:DUF4419 domain-containing protein [Salegentibacter echinorum]SHG56111.1 protein of unknown function [Salegentibacter echinorum]
MKNLIKTLLICFPLILCGQEGITFEVEELSPPDKFLRLQSYNDIYENLILKDADLRKWDLEQHNLDFDYKIMAKSAAPDSLVNYGYNSFFNGMYAAYADHRPFVLSPDMVWLLISQGFARHVNANPEILRKDLVDFSGKLSLVVESEDGLTSDVKKWEAVFPQFTSQIAEHTGEELIGILSSDFSTTTSIERVASEITIMEAMEPYFEFVHMLVVCGIPKITLEGTPEDWQKILDKTRKLEEYNLKWWTGELEPLLQEFVRASSGVIDKDFWRNMFKYHSQEKYGAPNIIDGWIVKFFPYDKDGKRNNLKKLEGGGSLPEEMVKVDLKHVEVNGGHTQTTMLELWAGFIGLEQNPETFALTPKISWMIRKKDVDQEALQQKLEAENYPSYFPGSGINLRIIEIPEVLKNLEEIYTLNLEFTQKVHIPKWLKEIRIGQLKITGEISKSEKEKIIKWFPKTQIEINGRKTRKEGTAEIIIFPFQTSKKSGQINDEFVIVPFPTPNKSDEINKEDRNPDSGEETAIKSFTEAEIKNNPKSHRIRDNSWIVVRDSIPESLKKLDEIWVLEVRNYNFENEIQIPDWIGDIKIRNISVINKTTPENIKKIKSLLPETKIYVNRVRVQ